MKVNIQEEYVAGITPKYQKNAYYEIFKNPDSSELRDLAKTGAFARFIAIKDSIYVFSAELLHASAINELNLPISNDPALSVAFLGVAKINGSKLSLHVTNQTLNPRDIDKLESYHPVLKRFFE